jgi:hypothetical protein
MGWRGFFKGECFGRLPVFNKYGELNQLLDGPSPHKN